MPYIVLIDKYGKAKEQKIKDHTDAEFYKKAGFKKQEGFAKRHTWESNISVYAKTEGSAGRENKFEFPPPADNVLFFGTVVVAKCDITADNKIVDLTLAEWKQVYERLYGGFEDLDEDNDEDDEEENAQKEEEKNIDPTLLTKQGYMKDNFIVEDDELELEYESELSEEEYFG